MKSLQWQLQLHWTWLLEDCRWTWQRQELLSQPRNSVTCWLTERAQTLDGWQGDFGGDGGCPLALMLSRG
ncbi:hypothetical protein EUGRSUZ_D01472 [Eucalyptus grandis]|uniref:Uncharacterized protein n=2 Tax=Eucalyptus grandis TaxID=71139 RepID=A0ACC3L401_EUCGR|nr:hypothetical protein EUGRSUZ_D01472 [Eucalyptus grandis]